MTLACGMDTADLRPNAKLKNWKTIISTSKPEENVEHA